MIRTTLAAAAAAALLAPALHAQASYPVKGTGTVVLRAARVIDGTGAAPIANGEVVVTDDHIVAVGRQGAVTEPAGARVIDLGDATLLPGFIDAHVHIIGRALNDPGSNDAAVRDFPSFGAILGAENARRTLMNGFTTVRVLGSPNFDDVALRTAIDGGYAVGPRMQVAAHAIGITGGHCDENGFRPGLMDTDYRQGVADGLEQVRAAVRYQAKYGADVIKMCATGGVLSEGDAVGVPQFTQEEMNALVEEAHKLERPVAAHAHGAEGIRMAVRAGVSSIEHGSFLDEEGARMMATRGTFLVPTLSAGETVVAAADRGVLTGLRAQKARDAGAAMRRAIRIAVAAGVPIALGTDAGVGPHGANGHEFTLMAEWGGMTPMQVIVAGTSNAAKLLGWQNRIGTLAPGKLADVVAVAGDPMQNVRTLETATFVMKNGVVYKEPQPRR
ncbi:amidohydrolase family protein [Longimicrobium sp.]|uniref:metal-dependent hydrolase family protein n=1 Tax=Longimicrobium sp. TaxID=2029185 RepID=UPI002BBA354B|nr:amidohydrolase family protein [Longimicrobium sp.]HSU12755.1 amidohydrolase family protein [Longimicrobium sp.]